MVYICRLLRKKRPQVTAFTHAHRSSWHSPDMVLDMERLRWDHVPGYATLSRRGSFHWRALSSCLPSLLASSCVARFAGKGVLVPLTHPSTVCLLEDLMEAAGKPACCVQLSYLVCKNFGGGSTAVHSETSVRAGCTRLIPTDI